MDLKEKPLSFQSHVQTFFRGKRICYFPTETPTSTANEINVDDFMVFQSQYSQFDAIVDEVVKPEYREIDQFLYKEDWISHVTGYKLSDLSTLTRLPQLDDILAPIRSEAFILMSKIQAAIRSAGFHVRRLLGRRPS
jgi:peptidase E